MTRAILERVLASVAPVVGKIAVALMTGRGLTGRNILAWATALREAAKSLEDIA